MNLLQATKVARRMERVARVLNDATSKRLASLLEARSKQQRDGSDSGLRYEEGYKDGLNAGLTVSKMDFADLDVEEICEALDGVMEEEQG